MNESEGDAVGVVLGPSAYPSFPILPSLSPYPLPYPPPYGIRVDRKFQWRYPTWCRPSGLPLTLLPLPKQVIYVQCAAERR